VTVALSGEGADELFGGYRRHLLQQRLGWVRALPGLAPVARAGRRFGLIPHRVGQALEALATQDPVRNHLEWSQTIARSLAGSHFDPELVGEFERDAVAAFTPYFEHDPDGLSARLAADLQEWLPHDLLVKVDRASMAFSLEARVPYLGRDVVSFVTALPDAVKIRGGETKILLRRALAGIVPESVIARPKQGFDLPLGRWIRGPLRELAVSHLDERRLRRWPGLVPGEVSTLLARHLSGAQDFGLPLFNLLSVALFLERHGL
jgi:asparagine synthase (glutamine-hydrolysing)